MTELQKLDIEDFLAARCSSVSYSERVEIFNRLISYIEKMIGEAAIDRACLYLTTREVSALRGSDKNGQNGAAE